MHWILQENLFKESEWDNLVSELDRLGLPYSVHKVIPFIGELFPDIDPPSEKVICFGSYSLRHASRTKGWSPGVYDLFDQNFTVQLQHWGDHMLNHDSTVIKFKNVPLLVEPTFMRPIDDSKLFAGKVFMPDEFNSWKHEVVDLGYDYGISLEGDSLVQICVPKTIYAEYRYWIVGGAIATKSLYKRGDRLLYSPDVDPYIDRFVMERVDQWQPHRAFVIDVCETPDGLKIVEINTLNSAGFYKGDVKSLVHALEELESNSGFM